MNDLSHAGAILWFPLVRYLSIKPYQDLVHAWDRENRHVLVDTSAYSDKFKPIQEAEREQLLEVFDEVYVLKPFKKRYSKQGNINEYLKYRELKKRLRDLNQVENFALGVFPTDFSFEFRVLRKIAPNIKLVVLQVSFKRIEKLRSYGLKHRIKALLFDKVLGVPLFRSQYHFGNQDLKAWYLFWTEKWAKSILKPDKTKIVIADSTIEVDSSAPVRALGEELKERMQDRPLVTLFLNKRLSIGEKAFEEYADFYQNLITSCPDYFFVVKVHPYEDPEYCRKLYDIESLENGLMVFSEYQPLDLLVNSQLFITQWSTAILDAMMYRVPTILVNPNQHHSMRKWFVDDFPFIVTEKDTLPHSVHKLLADKEDYWVTTQTFILDSFGPSFQNGHQKVLTQMYKIMDA